MDIQKTIELGMVPPQNIEMERAVLSALMIDGTNSIGDIINIIGEHSFYEPKNAIVYKAILELYEENKPIDIGLIAHKINSFNKFEEIGGAFYLIELSSTVASSANIEYHARIVAQKYIQREAIKIFTEGIKKAYDNSISIFDTISQIEDKLELTSGNSVSEPVPISSLVKDVLHSISNAQELSLKGCVGVDTGFNKLNKLIGGWMDSCLIIIAGRPGMGKTALALSAMENNSHDNFLFFSLEMSKLQISKRIISMNSGIPLEAINKGSINSDDTITITNRAGGLKRILIDDDPEINIRQMKSKIKKFKENGGKAVFIDYIQLINLSQEEAKGKNREQQIAYISRKLKVYSKIFQIPIIALAQLSRSSEQRIDKKPNLSDLRESGALEQDADVVIFPHRAEYYDKNASDENGESLQGRAEIIVAKNRDGSTDNFYVQFIGSLTKFTSLD